MRERMTIVCLLNKICFLELLALIRIKRAYLVGLLASVGHLSVQVRVRMCGSFSFSSLKIFLCKEWWF
jgi:hypothetical protein